MNKGIELRMADIAFQVAIVVAAGLAVVIPLALGYRSRSKTVPTSVQVVPASTLIPTTPLPTEPSLGQAEVERPSKIEEQASGPIELPTASPSASLATVTVEQQEVRAPEVVDATNPAPSEPMTTSTTPSELEAKPAPKRTRSNKPRRTRTTKAKKETA